MEWDTVNRRLQHQGFKPVHFADPAENKNLSDLVLLEKTSSAELRATLRTMLTDSERRQALIQELIQSNTKLKQEAEHQQAQAAHQTQKAEELERVLTGVKVKVQNLEDLMIGKAAQQQGQFQQLQQHKDTEKQVRVLQQQLSKQKELAFQLQKKLHFAEKEEERNCQRCSLCTHQFSDSQNPDPSTITSSSYKALLKSYQEQLKKTKAQREDLKKEIQSLKQELASSTAQRSRTEEYLNSSTETECQRYLKEICSELKVQDVSHVIAVLKARCKEADSCVKLEKLLGDVMAVLNSPRAPLALLKQPDDADRFGDYRQLEQIVPTLQIWSQQLSALPDLERSVSRLMKRLVPWQSDEIVRSCSECVKVEDLMLMVDTLLDETSPEDKVLCSPTKPTLEAMVSHFQKLFDAPSLRGVYPRMNEVYTRLSEMSNAMRNLRDLLDLDDRASPGDVVNRVARILTEDFSNWNLHTLLGSTDFNSIIVKLKEYEEFFPAFRTLVLELLHVLGAESLDDILPCVRELKLAAQ